jgi:hypothetical protein
MRRVGVGVDKRPVEGGTCGFVYRASPRMRGNAVDIAASRRVAAPTPESMNLADSIADFCEYVAATRTPFEVLPLSTQIMQIYCMLRHCRS